MRKRPDSTNEDATSDVKKTAPDRVDSIRSLSDIAAEVSRRETSPDTFSSWELHSWVDLARLALVAQQGELSANCERTLSDCAAAHLREVLGERPPHYYVDLLHCGRVLRVLALAEGGRWQVVSQDSELLGATQRETFPAMCAVWLKDPPSIGNRALTSPNRVEVRLEFLRLLHLLEADSWYPYETLGVLLTAAAERQSADLDKVGADECRELAERVLLPIGAVALNRERDHFSLHDGLQIPPLPEEDPAQRKRVNAFRSQVRASVADSNRWRRVATGLIRCLETRRARSASSRSVRCLDPEGQHLSTDPQLPFKDCLFVAQLGRLTPPHPAREQEAVGQFTFRLDGDLIRRRVKEGLPVKTIAAFLAERCEEDSYKRFRTLLERAVPDQKF